MTLPTPQSFFIDDGLYKKYSLTGSSPAHFSSILNGNCTVDAYCIKCKRMSIWQGYTRSFDLKPDQPVDNQERNITFRCAYDNNHIMRFLLVIINNNIFKIGQYPSLLDIANPEVEKYRKVIGDKADELKSAIILHAEEYSIGAFAYIRRVFEFLIDRAENTAKKNTQWIKAKAEEYEKRKNSMPSRIELLKEFLPQQLVEKRSMYASLSEGVHNLAEEECGAFFSSMRIGIIAILDDEIDRRRKVEEEKEFAQAQDEINKLRKN